MHQGRDDALTTRSYYRKVKSCRLGQKFLGPRVFPRTLRPKPLARAEIETLQEVAQRLRLYSYRLEFGGWDFMGNEEVITILNGLIATCKDGLEGYRPAADTTTNGEFRRLFNIFSQQRAQFVTELQAEVHRLGGKPEEFGGSVVRLHRGWSGLKAAIRSGVEALIIEECQDGEETTVNNYQEALKANLPLDV